MQADQKQTLRETLAMLATTHAAVAEQIERTIFLLTVAIESEDSNMGMKPTTVSNVIQSPFVDRQTLSIHWRGASCHLGNTLLFRFFERIARSPNCYVTYRDLLNDVWRGPRDHSTIRGVVKRLRDRLADSGMTELAAAIDGSASGNYGLMLD